MIRGVAIDQQGKPHRYQRGRKEKGSIRLEKGNCPKCGHRKMNVYLQGFMMRQRKCTRCHYEF